MNQEAITNRKLQYNGYLESPRNRYKDLALNSLIIAATVICIMSYRLPLFNRYLYAPTPIFSFGTVKTGDLVSHRYIVKNLHPWPVKVTEIKTSCGCTSTSVGKTLPATLKPGETLTINTKMDTSVKRGKVIQRINVITNDNPEGTILYIRGDITPVLPKGILASSKLP